MRHKHIFYIIFLIFILNSCKKDLLDKGYLDRFQEEAIWSDKNLANGFIASTYESVIFNLYYNRQTDDWTDNSCNNYADNVSTENIDNSYNAGWNQYGLIRRCNLIMEKVTASNGIIESDKKVMVAEARFLRGMIYYYLAQRFGGAMIVDKVYDQNEADFRFPRKSIQETYDFVLSDLSAAVADLPSTASTGKATKGAALAMTTRVALQAAAYVPAKRDDYLQKVITAAEQVFAMGYTMDADYFGMFNSFEKAQASKELILAYFRRAINTTFSGNTPMQSLTPNTGNEKISVGYGPAFAESFEGWPDRFPSQNLIDEYLVLDGGVAKKWDETSYYAAYQLNGGYASQVLYRNRDKRFYASIVYDSTKLFNNEVWTRDLGNMNRLGNKFSDWGMSESNYYWRKTLYETKKVWYSDPTDHHQSIIRLGEVYLNYAEALLLKNRPTDAVAAINQTRVAHGGLPAIAALPLTEAWDAYKNERRVDMALENDRYWALLRWAKFNNQDDIPELHEDIRRVDISADGKTFSFATVTLNNNSNRTFTKRRFLFPVPLSEIQANENLRPNNDGW